VSDVRREWTHDEAVAAQKRFMEAGGDISDRNGPYVQWRALQELDRLQRRFESGKRYALALALHVCAAFEVKIPRWAADAYLEGIEKITHFRADSWDVIFGPAIPKGRHLASLRKRLEKASKVRMEVWLRHRNGEPIDDQLFEAVGQKFGIGTTLAKQYYTSKQRRVDALSKALADPISREAEILQGLKVLLEVTRKK
jgi:hypothetical protein